MKTKIIDYIYYDTNEQFKTKLSKVKFTNQNLEDEYLENLQKCGYERKRNLVIFFTITVFYLLKILYILYDKYFNIIIIPLIGLLINLFWILYIQIKKISKKFTIEKFKQTKKILKILNIIGLVIIGTFMLFYRIINKLHKEELKDLSLSNNIIDTLLSYQNDLKNISNDYFIFTFFIAFSIFMFYEIDKILHIIVCLWVEFSYLIFYIIKVNSINSYIEQYLEQNFNSNLQKCFQINFYKNNKYSICLDEIIYTIFFNFSIFFCRRYYGYISRIFFLKFYKLNKYFNQGEEILNEKDSFQISIVDISRENKKKIFINKSLTNFLKSNFKNNFNPNGVENLNNHNNNNILFTNNHFQDLKIKNNENSNLYNLINSNMISNSNIHGASINYKKILDKNNYTEKLNESSTKIKHFLPEVNQALNEFSDSVIPYIIDEKFIQFFNKITNFSDLLESLKNIKLQKIKKAVPHCIKTFKSNFNTEILVDKKIKNILQNYEPDKESDKIINKLQNKNKLEENLEPIPKENENEIHNSPSRLEKQESDGKEQFVEEFNPNGKLLGFLQEEFMNVGYFIIKNKKSQFKKFNNINQKNSNEKIDLNLPNTNIINSKEENGIDFDNNLNNNYKSPKQNKRPKFNEIADKLKINGIISENLIDSNIDVSCLNKNETETKNYNFSNLIDKSPIQKSSYIKSEKQTKDISFPAHKIKSPDVNINSNLNSFTAKYNEFTNITNEICEKLFLIKLRYIKSLDIIDFIFVETTLAKIVLEMKSEIGSKQKYFAKIAHEFKTPINSIIGLINKTKEDLRNSKSSSKNKKTQRRRFNVSNIENDLNLIQNLSNHTIYLINDVIQFSSFQASEKDPNNGIKINIEQINLREILEFCYNIAKALINCNQTKSAALKACLKYDNLIQNFIIRSDEIRLKQIVLNLVSNSVKFTKRGLITIKAEISESKNFIIISIIDTGLGIREADINKLFNENMMLNLGQNQNMNRMGSGLGLSICKNLSQRLGIKISVESKMNAGSTFKLEIPCRIPTRILSTDANSNKFKYICFPENFQNMSNKNLIGTLKNENSNSFKAIGGDSQKNNKIIRTINGNNGVDNGSNNYNQMDTKFNQEENNNVDLCNYKKTFCDPLIHVKKSNTLKMNSINKKRFTNKINDYDVVYYNEKKTIEIAEDYKNTLLSELKRGTIMDILEEEDIIFERSLSPEMNPQKLNLTNIKKYLDDKDLEFNNNKNFSNDSSEDDINEVKDERVKDIEGENIDINIKILKKLDDKESNDEFKLIKKKFLKDKSEEDFKMNLNLSADFSKIIPNNSKTLKNKNSSDKYIINYGNKENSDNSNLNNNYYNYQSNTNNPGFLSARDLNTSRKFSNNSVRMSCNCQCTCFSEKTDEIKPSLPKILIVDDNQFIRESFKKICKELMIEYKLEFNIVEGNDGIDILNYIITNQIDGLLKCTFTDENMEYINGTDAIRIIRNLERENKVSKNIIVSMTSYEDEGSKEFIMSAGADFIISKPYSKNQILTTLRKFNVV